MDDPIVAGTADTITVTAKDTYGNVKTDYTGTVVFTSDDPIAVLPANYNFILANAGVKAFAGVILKTTGDKYIKVEDQADATKNGQQAAITVTPAALGSF